MKTTRTVNPQRDALQVALNAEIRYSPLRVPSAVVHIEDDESQPNPPAVAWYEPKTGDIHIHIDRAKINPTDANSRGRKDYAVTRGLLVHEASHAKNSAWLTTLWHTGIKPSVMRTLTMFEEMRVEARAVNADPDESRINLRASLPLAMGDIRDNPPVTRYDAANSWGLIYGRSLTTVVSHIELQWLDDAARTILGDDDVDQLGDILQEAIGASHRDAARLIQLAEEWIDLVGAPPEGEGGGGCGHGEPTETEPEGEKIEKGEPSKDAAKGEEDEDDGDAKATADGAAAEDESDGKPSRGKFNSEDDDEDEESAESESAPISKDAGELIKEMLDQLLDDVEINWSKVRVDMADPMDMAKRVFGIHRSDKDITKSAPTAVHHAAVAKTAKALEELVVPAISKVSVAAELPPGRLRTREAVRASAERAQGRMVTARPWEATKRRHTTSRPIVVGIATDVSGSMGWAEQMVADFAYTWTNAGRRIGARTAAVTFGDTAQAIAGPGEVLSEVPRRSANGGKERADHALAALDGVLKLSHNNGAAKLLVIVSDGVLVISNEMDRVRQRLADFKLGGTTVIWVTPERSYVKGLVKLGLVEIVEVSMGRGSFDQVQEEVLKKISQLSH